MRALSFVTAVVIDGRQPEKPLQAKSLGFSDTLWKLTQLCWSESSSTRPTAIQLFDELSDLAITWDPPQEYPIKADPNDTTGADPSDSLGVTPANLIPEV